MDIGFMDTSLISNRSSTNFQSSKGPLKDFLPSTTPLGSSWAVEQLLGNADSAVFKSRCGNEISVDTSLISNRSNNVTVFPSAAKGRDSLSTTAPLKSSRAVEVSPTKEDLAVIGSRLGTEATLVALSSPANTTHSNFGNKSSINSKYPDQMSLHVNQTRLVNLEKHQETKSGSKRITISASGEEHRNSPIRNEEKYINTTTKNIQTPPRYAFAVLGGEFEPTPSELILMQQAAMASSATSPFRKEGGNGVLIRSASPTPSEMQIYTQEYMNTIVDDSIAGSDTKVLESNFPQRQIQSQIPPRSFDPKLERLLYLRRKIADVERLLLLPLRHEAQKLEIDLCEGLYRKSNGNQPEMLIAGRPPLQMAAFEAKLWNSNAFLEGEIEPQHLRSPLFESDNAGPTPSELLLWTHKMS